MSLTWRPPVQWRNSYSWGGLATPQDLAVIRRSVPVKLAPQAPFIRVKLAPQAPFIRVKS